MFRGAAFTLCLGLLAPAIAFAQAPLCDMSPVDFPGSTFVDALKVISSTPPNIPDGGRLRSSRFALGESQWSDKFKKQVRPVLLTMQFDASDVAPTWTSEIKKNVNQDGCSNRQAENFRHSINGGQFRGDFHVKHVQRSCGDWPFGLGSWQTDLWTVEADGWQVIAPVIGNDKKGFTFAIVNGGYSDNVRQEIKDVLQFLGNLTGNVISLTPLGWASNIDEQVFSQLKQLREVGSELRQYRVLDATFDAPDLGMQENALDLQFSDVSFTGQSAAQLQVRAILASVPGNELGEGSGCQLLKSMRVAKTQLENVGLTGRTYSVSAGDSLTTIAKTNFGSETYASWIASYNGIPVKRWNAIAIGQHLDLKPLSACRPPACGVLTRRGDSIWRMTTDGRSGGLGAADVIRANRKQIDQPDLIYPLQVIKMAPERQ